MPRSATVALVFLVFCLPSVIGEDGNILTVVTQSGKSAIISGPKDDGTSLQVFLNWEGLSIEDPVVYIEGFDQLANLKNVSFVLSPQIIQYRFLAQAPALERVTITHGRVDGLEDFVSIPGLRVLALQLCSGTKGDSVLREPVCLDLSGFPALEFLELDACGLTQLPVFKNVPPSVKAVSLRANEFILTNFDFSDLDRLGELPLVFLSEWALDADGNAIPSNISFAYPWEVFPEYYCE